MTYQKRPDQIAKEFNIAITAELEIVMAENHLPLLVKFFEVRLAQDLLWYDMRQMSDPDLYDYAREEMTRLKHMESLLLLKLSKYE